MFRGREGFNSCARVRVTCDVEWWCLRNILDVDFFLKETRLRELTSSPGAPSTPKNHREEEYQEGNNSPKIETLLLFPIHGGFHHDFFSVKALDLSSHHSVGGYYTARMVMPHLSSLSTHMDKTTDFYIDSSVEHLMYNDSISTHLIFGSDNKMSQMLTQLESQPEFGSGSGSGGVRDDEPGDDVDDSEDEEDDEDADS
nr:homeodomain-containing protein [Tanacetum cinerariifolium]